MAEEEAPVSTVEATEVDTPAVAAGDEDKPKAPVKRPDRKGVERQTQTLNGQIESINDDIAKIDKRIEDIKKQIEAANEQRNSGGDELSKERQKRDEIKAQLEKVKVERDALAAQLDAIKGKVDSAIETSKSAKSGMKFKSVEDIDAEIAKLEKTQSTTRMSLADETRLVKDIASLKSQKRQLQSLKCNQDDIDRDKEDKSRVGAELKAKRDEFGRILAQLNAQREVVDGLSKNGDDKKGKIPSLIEERKALSEKKKEHVAAIREVQKKIKELWDEFKQQKKDFDVYMDEERKVRDAQRKIRDEEYQKKLEEEELKKVPFEEEMALCDYLVSYLKSTFLSEDAGAAETKSAPADAAATFEHGGVVLKAYKRDDDDEVVGKKKGGAKKPKAKKDAVIVHAADTLASFALLSLEPPTRVAKVADAIDALVTKKQWFTTQPRPPRKTAVAASTEEGETTAKPEKGAKKGKAKEFKTSDEDFPSLGGPKPAAAAAPAAPAEVEA